MSNHFNIANNHFGYLQRLTIYYSLFYKLKVFYAEQYYY